MNSTSPTSVSDFGSVRLTLRADLKISPRETGGQHYYLLEDPLASRFYRVGTAEFDFLQLLNGHTIRDAIQKYEDQYPRLDGPPTAVTRLSRPNLLRLCQWLLQSRLADAENVRMVDPAPASSPSYVERILFVRIPLFNPDRLLARLLPRLGWTLTRPAVLVWTLVCLSGAWQVAVQWERFANSVTHVFAAGNWWHLLLTWLGLKIVHEGYHGLICKKYGGAVPQFGLSFILFSPVAYVDVTSSVAFRSKWQRIHTAGGGMYAEFFIAAIAAWIWAYSTTGVTSQICHNVIVMASISTLLFNANFLMKFDGYLILSDLLDIQNLYTISARYRTYFVRQYLLGVQATLPRWPARRGLIVRAYAWASLAWKITFYIGVIVVLTAMFHGAGLLLAVACGMAWVVVPGIQFVRYLWRGNPHEQPNRIRFASVMAVLSAIGLLIARLPSPGGITAPGVVEYSPWTVVRAECPGFVSCIHVRSGQRVCQNDPLLTLDNPELRRALADVELRIQQSLVKSRVLHIDRDLPAWQVERAQQEALEKQRAELARQVQALHIRAPSPGQVLARELDSFLGRYVTSGTELLAIGDEDRKQITVSMAQGDFAAFQSCVGTRVSVRIKGVAGRIDSARLRQVDAKASTRLACRALGAHWGGPLATKDVPANSQGPTEPELLQPRFGGAVSLPAAIARKLPAGGLAKVRIQATGATIGQRIWKGLCAWLSKTSARSSLATNRY
jgi:putative peptide zinc metalloprotease protein